MEAEPIQTPTDAHVVVAEPPLPQAPEPPVRYQMKRQHKPEHWEFISLVPKSEFAHLPVDALTSAEAGSAYCHRCKSPIAYAKGQTSSISNHMRLYHPEHLLEYPQRKKARTQAPLVNAFAVLPPDDKPTNIVRATKEQQAHFKRLLAKWCATSNRPLDIVSDQGLEDAVNYVTRELTGLQISMPSRSAIRLEVTLLAAELRASLKAIVKREARHHSATTDIWTDRAMRSYICYTIHYLDANFVLNDWTLEVEPLPGMHTGKDIADALRSIYTRWDLDRDECVRLVRDGAKNAKAGARDFGVESFSCIAHCLHLVVSSALTKQRGTQPRSTTQTMQQEDLNEYRATTDPVGSSSVTMPAADPEDTDDLLAYLQELACAETEQYVEENLHDETLKQALASMRETVQVFRTLAVYFKNSAKAKNRLEMIRNNVQKDTKAMFALDCPTRWSSSWEMLAHFVQLELTVNTFFVYLGTPEGKREFSNQKLVAPTSQQWFAARCLLRLLEPFALAVEHLSGSKYPTLAVTHPVLRYIKSELMRGDIFDDDIDFADDLELTGPVRQMHKVQAALLKLFRDRFKEDDPLMLWVPQLDPRLTDLDHLEEVEKPYARQLFLDELIALAESNDQFCVGVGSTSAQRITTPVKAKAKAKLKSAVFGRRARSSAPPTPSSLPPNTQALCERAIADYLRATSSVDADVDPLGWWQQHHQEHPLVALLARKYLSCVATSVPSERAFSTGGNVVTIKRCSLSPSVVRDMVFISQNSKQDLSA